MALSYELCAVVRLRSPHPEQAENPRFKARRRVVLKNDEPKVQGT